MTERKSIFDEVLGTRGGIVRAVVRVGLVCPWIWLTSVYCVWLVACIQLRRPPRPLLDDPQILGGWVDATHKASVVLMLFVPPILVLSLIAALATGVVRRAPWRIALRWVAALLVSWLLAGALARFDPGYVIAWFID
jgi:hypothetical protein